ncbi:hypothetical protein JYK22_22700, partial [Nonomuraea sp. RK-328]|nr:hypothetical protein [Nonomuraea sp. RK-328]
MSDAATRLFLERGFVIGFTGPEFARMIAGSPALTARLRELHDQREDALTRVLAADTAAGPGDLTPRAAAALLTAAHRTLFQHILDLTSAGTSEQEIAAVVAGAAHQVFDLLQ